MQALNVNGYNTLSSLVEVFSEEGELILRYLCQKEFAGNNAFGRMVQIFDRYDTANRGSYKGSLMSMHHDVDINGEITSIDFAYGTDFQRMSLEKIKLAKESE
jgi:hypothetical protein